MKRLLKLFEDKIIMTYKELWDAGYTKYQIKKVMWSRDSGKTR